MMTEVTTATTTYNNFSVSLNSTYAAYCKWSTAAIEAFLSRSALLVHVHKNGCERSGAGIAASMHAQMPCSPLPNPLSIGCSFCSLFTHLHGIDAAHHVQLGL